MAKNLSFYKFISVVFVLFAFSGNVLGEGIDGDLSALMMSNDLQYSTTMSIDEVDMDEIIRVRNANRAQIGPQRDAEIEGKFLLISDPDFVGWGDVAVIFDANNVDYDRVYDPASFADLNLCQYDVIWVDEYQTDDWNTAYNDNREPIDNWVEQGGVLYHCTGTNFYDVKPIHPGGLEYAGDELYEYGYTAVPPEDCSLFDALGWGMNTAIWGNYFSHTYYSEADLADISGDYQILVTSEADAAGNPLVARYGYGYGQVVVSGTTDGAAYNWGWPDVTWGLTEHEIFHYLLSLSNIHLKFFCLCEYVDMLKDDGVLNRGQANSLCVKVRNAWRAYDRGQIHTAINVFGAFVNEVNAYMRGGILTEAEGQTLIDMAEYIISTLDSMIDGSGDELQVSDGMLPSSISLNSAYPNPFNSSTKISFGIPEAGYVELSVVDLTGRLVGKLVNGFVSAGSHNYTFDARNLESGIYLVKLSSQGQTMTQKITFIK